MTARTIVVPLDGSVHALGALPIATTLAELKGATLHLVHVGPDPEPLPTVLERIGVSRSQLHGAVLHAETGDAAAGITEIASELGADLVVMCTHTASRLATPLGRTALGVLHAAPCPVVVVSPKRGLVPWTLRAVLLPHDGTPTTSAAIEPAVDLARRADAELAVLHVASAAARPPHERGAFTSPRYIDQPQHEWPAWVQEFLGRLGCACDLGSLKLRMVLVQGSPGDEILRFAAEHATDLVVLAWHGRWQGQLAATAKAVIRGADCPVMIVRAKD